MKKLICIIMCVALAAGLVACSGGSGKGENYFTDVKSGKDVALGMSEAEVSAILGPGEYDEEIDEYSYHDGAVAVEYFEDAAIYLYVTDDGSNYKISGFKQGMTEEEVEKTYDDVTDYSAIFGDMFTEISYSAYYDADNNKVALDAETEENNDNMAYSVSVRYDDGVYTGFDIIDLAWGGDEAYDDEMMYDEEYLEEDAEGNLVDAEGNIVQDAEGNLYDENGNIIEDDGEADYYVDEEGNITDADGNPVDMGDMEWETEEDPGAEGSAAQ